MFEINVILNTFGSNYTLTMKRLALVLAVLASTLSSFGQDSTTTGYIRYKSIRDMSDNEWMRRRPDMPTEITQQWDLYFTPESSDCTFRPEEEDDDFNTGGMHMRMMRWEPKDVYHIDFATQFFQHYTEFMTKPFLITDTLNMDGWKLTGKQGIVLGYPCIEARTTKYDTVDILAWFTPRIRLKTGPQEYVGFPGAVLYVDYDDGLYVITAEAIVMGKTRPEEEETPEIPDNGEEVTREEYEQIVIEKTAERRRMYGR